MKKVKANKIVRIRVDTLLTRVVNECLKKNIALVKIVYKNGFVEADINNADRSRFCELSIKNNWEHKFITKYGLVNSLSETIKRTGLVLGVLVAICAVVLMQNFTVNYKVIGETSPETEEIIQSYLGKKYLKVSKEYYKKLELELDGADGIANANVYKRGLYVFVELKEELPTDSVIEEEKNKTVISKFDAIVTRIITLSGTPLVSSGTRVKKGEILIDGYYIFQENKLETYAKGEVYGKIYKSEKLTVLKDKTVKKRTGKKEVFTTVTMPGKNVNISNLLKKCKFKEYDVEVNSGRINGILPLSLTKVTAFETETVTEYASENGLNITAQIIIEQMKTAVGVDGILLDSYVKITDIGNAYVVEVFTEFETRIA